MIFPMLEEVEKADREQLCRWHRFLPSGDTDERVAVQNRIRERFTEVGGFTPELSKTVGWVEK
jgi:hypothetical protein